MSFFDGICSKDCFFSFEVTFFVQECLWYILLNFGYSPQTKRFTWSRAVASVRLCSSIRAIFDPPGNAHF